MKITAAERKTWSRKAKEYAKELEDAFDLSGSEIVTLIEVCRAISRLDAINTALQDGDLTSVDRYGVPVTHPLIVEARLTSANLARLIGALRVPEIVEDAETGQATVKKGSKKPRRAAVRPGMYAPTLTVVPGA